MKTISIIGTRKPTDYGREFTYKFAYELAKQGVVIVSGLAIGVDTIAHQAALDAGGTTIAILPAGLDKTYPSSNAKLAQEIINKGGCLITQFAPGSRPYKSSFVQRSVIVSGIADGVLVVEAAAKSGTIHTAGFAKRYGRALMALPGNINSLASEGCNNLIKAGATAVTCTEDILKAINFRPETRQLKLLPTNTPAEVLILRAIKSGYGQADEIQKTTRLSPTEISQALTMLEISGQIKTLGGKWLAKL